MKATSFFSLLFLLSSVMFAQEGNQSMQLREALQQIDKGAARMDSVQALRGYEAIKNLHATHPTSPSEYYLTYAEYRLCRFGGGLFNRYIDDAIQRVNQMVNEQPNSSDARALFASLLGVKLLNLKDFSEAAIIAPEANLLANRAVQLDSTNPRAWLVLGTMKYNSPEFMGGSVKVARGYFEKSVALFESAKPMDEMQPTWGYADALMWLGRAYDALGQKDLALTTFKKALKVEPDFVLVKDKLLPALEKKMKK